MSDIGVETHITELAEGRIAGVTIDNRKRLNCLNSELIGQLEAAFTNLAADEELRVVVLTGAGDYAFIGGADINELATLDIDSARAFITGLHKAIAAIRSLPVPVIARINGYTFGAGLEVAAGCDFRIASTVSDFGMPEVKLGIPSVIEAALLPRLIGWGRANELLLTGATIDSEIALDWGLIERAVPEDQLDSEIEELIGRILSNGARAVRLQKALIREWETLPLDQAIEAGIEALARAYETDEPRRLAQAFLDRKRGD